MVKAVVEKPAEKLPIKKLCPLRQNSVGDFLECIKENCGWWSKRSTYDLKADEFRDTSCCAILRLSLIELNDCVVVAKAQ